MGQPAQVQRRDPLGGSRNGRVCAGTKRDGSPCTALASPGALHCYNHDPNRVVERKRNASRAGKSKPGARVKDLDAQLSRLYDDVLAGRVERGVAAVATQIVYGRTRLIEVERRIAEVEAFEERVAQLEAIVADQKQRGGRHPRW